MIKDFFSKIKVYMPSFWRRIFSNLRYFLGFFVVAELLFVSFYFLNQFYSKYQDLITNFQYLLVTMFILIILSLLYLLIVNSIKLYRSKRIDIVLSSLAGLFLFYSLHIRNLNYSVNFEWMTLFIMPSYPWFVFLFFAIILFIIAQLIKLSEKEKPLFLSDDALENSEKDCLGYKEDAEIFSEQVLNNMSRSSFVFGLDAPWGMGKSSFINICKKYWQSNDKVIILDFEPLRFENNDSLFKSFVNELIRSIRKNGVAPEIQSVFYKYIRSILQDMKIGFSVFSLPIFNKHKNIDDKFESLKEELKIFNKKIIVIIDDLDRLPASYVKTILDIVKKSFTFPNITYVLCYDTENLNCIDNTLKITESTTIEETNRLCVKNKKH